MKTSVHLHKHLTSMAEPFCAKMHAKPCRNAPGADQDLERFVRAMWRAFPEATSENHLATLVTDFLNKERREVSIRTVRYWISHATSPHFRYVTRVLGALEDDDLTKIIRGRRR